MKLNKAVTPALLALLLSVMCPNLTFANQISANFLKQEMHYAHKKYLTGSVDEGLSALKSLASFLETTPMPKELGPNNLAFTYLRIGLLYERGKNTDKAQKYFTKTLENLEANNDKNTQANTPSISELKQLVMKLDSLSSSS